ncbi:hypothetical protein ACJ41O_001890 [Fusarium nematophilum]
MKRRKHRKSRQGCLECKRRHIKCDETRPICSNCSITERECSYRTALECQSPGVVGASPVASQDATSPSSISSQPPQLGLSLQPPTGAGILHDEINIRHMELLVHFSISIPVPEIDPALSSEVTKLILDVALSNSYLLHEALAISARHLATVKPAQSASHLQQAAGLQKRAIEEFNSLQMHIDSSNCVAILLFSSILGRHFFADALAMHHRGEFTAFVDRYVQYVQVHRGMKAVAAAAWPFLIQSELQSLLSWGSGLSSMLPRGGEYSELAASISKCPGLDRDATEACLGAIHYLQVGLDHLSRVETRTGGLQIMFNWAVLSPSKFTELLAVYQPEALVIFGHYTMLLHLCRDMWQVGYSGCHILDGIVAYLGDEWETMLSWPLSRLGCNTPDSIQGYDSS